MAGINRVIFTAWMGDNPMSTNRGAMPDEMLAWLNIALPAIRTLELEFTL